MPNEFIDNSRPIKVGFLISYDYQLLKNALPLVYNQATVIALALDSQLKTWTGNDLLVDKNFFAWLEEFDREKKIKIYRDKFYSESLSPMECETLERRKLADFMGLGGWHVQLDADEYFLNFGNFVRYLQVIDRKYSSAQPIEIFAELLPLFKKDGKGYYIIETREKFPVATNIPSYMKARNCGHKLQIQTSFGVVHQSWARSPNEIRQKIDNWGHTHDFDIEGFYKLWATLDHFNYHELKNFHPMHSTLWPSLYYIESAGIESLLSILLQSELEMGSACKQETWLAKFKRQERRAAEIVCGNTTEVILRVIRSILKNFNGRC